MRERQSDPEREVWTFAGLVFKRQMRRCREIRKSNTMLLPRSAGRAASPMRARCSKNYLARAFPSEVSRKPKSSSTSLNVGSHLPLFSDPRRCFAPPRTFAATACPIKPAVAHAVFMRESYWDERSAQHHSVMGKEPRRAVQSPLDNSRRHQN